LINLHLQKKKKKEKKKKKQINLNFKNSKNSYRHISSLTIYTTFLPFAVIEQDNPYIERTKKTPHIYLYIFKIDKYLIIDFLLLYHFVFDCFLFL